MDPRVSDEPGFIIVGIDARTDNAREMTGAGVIAKLWARILKENLLAQVPNKTDTSILAVYSEYVSDKDGEYNFMIGARVSSAMGVPDGMMVKKVPAGRYAIFTSERGPVEKVVVAVWQRIWAVAKAAPGGERAYQVDFEVYDERARDPRNAQVDVYVSIK